LTAPGVTHSSAAACLTERCRAAASKARRALRGGRRRFMRSALAGSERTSAVRADTSYCGPPRVTVVRRARRARVLARGNPATRRGPALWTTAAPPRFASRGVAVQAAVTRPLESGDAAGRRIGPGQRRGRSSSELACPRRRATRFGFLLVSRVCPQQLVGMRGGGHPRIDRRDNQPIAPGGPRNPPVGLVQ